MDPVDDDRAEVPPATAGRDDAHGVNRNASIVS